jgi:hypothetical protein
MSKQGGNKMSETRYIGANCCVFYADESLDKAFNVFIKFGEWVDDDKLTEEERRIDEGVFFYCKDVKELEQIYSQDFVEDFTIVSYELVEETQ